MLPIWQIIVYQIEQHYYLKESLQGKVPQFVIILQSIPMGKEEERQKDLLADSPRY